MSRIRTRRACAAGEAKVDQNTSLLDCSSVAFGVPHRRSTLADRIELPDQRMGGMDLIVPVGTDEQQMLQIRLDQQVLEEIERGGVEPLQVVEEQSQRVLRSGEDADESAKHQVKPSLRFRWRELGYWRLFADDVLQFRYEIDDQEPVGIERFAKRVTPRAEVDFVLAEKRADETLKRLGE